MHDQKPPVSQSFDISLFYPKTAHKRVNCSEDSIIMDGEKDTVYLGEDAWAPLKTQHILKTAPIR